NGAAQVRIGGEVRIRYALGWASGYGRAAAGTLRQDHAANYRSEYSGWTVSRTEVRVDLELSGDTSARLGVRYTEDGNGNFDATRLLNEAWWRWKNVGGSPLGLKVGYQNAPFGMMHNQDAGGKGWGGSGNGIILNPFVAHANTDVRNRPAAPLSIENNFVERDMTLPAAVVDYALRDGEIVLKAAVLSSPINISGGTLESNFPGVNTANEGRNLGLMNHVLFAGYNPCWLEGLHLEASYMGEFDQGMGCREIFFDPWSAENRALYQADHGEHVYRPSLDAAVYYKTAKWQAAAEMAMTFAPGYRDGFGHALTVGADWFVSERLMLSGEFDWLHYSGTSDSPLATVNGLGVRTEDVFRLTSGLKYEFVNGLFFQAQYLHDFMAISGVGDGHWKDQDAVILQTGFRF
ncbi:MAG: hypothetical protein J6333_07385, partial [Planctomycetes bacterium]|nr:hypothetical protein [Planctomycetota bacterium]